MAMASLSHVSLQDSVRRLSQDLPTVCYVLIGPVPAVPPAYCLVRAGLGRGCGWELFRSEGDGFRGLGYYCGHLASRKVSDNTTV